MTDCECGNPRTDRRPCATCRAIDAWRIRQDTTDAAIARVLRHHDWLSSYEIRHCVGLAPDDTACSSALRRLRSHRVVEVREIKGHGLEYRLKQRRAA
jgi:predicted transcriptional regulator